MFDVFFLSLLIYFQTYFIVTILISLIYDNVLNTNFSKIFLESAILICSLVKMMDIDQGDGTPQKVPLA